MIASTLAGLCEDELPGISSVPTSEYVRDQHSIPHSPTGCCKDIVIHLRLHRASGTSCGTAVRLVSTEENRHRLSGNLLLLLRLRSRRDLLIGTSSPPVLDSVGTYVRTVGRRERRS